MTVILTAEQVQKQSSDAAGERKRRLQFLGDEETRLVASVNKLRGDEVSERSRIAVALDKARADAKAEIVSLESQLAPLRAERAELMKPIEAIKAAIEERDVQSLAREVAVDLREEAVDAKEKDVSEREATFLEAAADKAQDLDEREESLDKREERVKDEEERSRKGAVVLSEKWVEYHAAVNAKEGQLRDRENMVTAAETGNAIRAAELDKRHNSQNDRDRELSDKYATLGRARAEFERMQNKNDGTS